VAHRSQKRVMKLHRALCGLMGYQAHDPALK
jgi:hypothetical protein